VPILSCIDRCLSFLAVALQWAGDHPQAAAATPSTPPEPEPGSEPSAASYIWEGTITDLIELAIAIYNIKLIRKASGELITYAEIVRALKVIFGVKLPKNIYSRKTRTMERKKNSSPLLERMLALYRHEVEEMYV
jgi:hypothetical protein